MKLIDALQISLEAANATASDEHREAIKAVRYELLSRMIDEQLADPELTALHNAATADILEQLLPNCTPEQQMALESVLNNLRP